MARLIGQLARLPEKGFPFVLRQAPGFPVGALIFTAVVEVLYVVVFILQRLDLGLNEGVQLGQLSDEFGVDIKVHGVSLWSSV